MFDTTMELITQATSNSLLVFCFCNLIIAILLIGSLKPSSYADQESAIPFTVVTNVEKNDKETENAEGRVLMDFNGVSDSEKGLVMEDNKEDDREEEEQEDEDDNDEEEEEEDGYDNEELRRRAEEFIEKINRGWRAEMLRTASLMQTENFQTRPRKIHAV